MPENRLVLDATLAERADLRFTPAGVAVLEVLLRHASRQLEVGAERRVEYELAGIAFADTARALAKVPAGAPLRCEGFLARRWRTGTSLALHVNRFELIDSER